MNKQELIQTLDRYRSMNAHRAYQARLHGDTATAQELEIAVAAYSIAAFLAQNLTSID